MNFLHRALSSGFRRIRETISSATPQQKITALLALIICLIASYYLEIPDLALLQDWARSLGPWFPIAFCAIYIAIVQFPIPRTILTLSSGVLFGPVLGIFVALFSTTVAAALSFVFVRRLFGPWIIPKLDSPLIQRINNHLEQRGWVAVTCLRMIAGIPFSILNYVAAMTKISCYSFTIATLIGSAPGTIATVLLGDALTGQSNPWLILIAILLAILGCCGLIIDSKIPVKPRR